MRSLQVVLAGLMLAATSLSASAGTFLFQAMMDGSQQNPPVNTNGFGTVLLSFDDTTGVLEVTSGFYDALTGLAIGSHVHDGDVGQNGPIVFGLDNTGGRAGTLSGSGVLDSSQASRLFANGYYVNVHSSVFGGGEIRGQIVPVTSQPAALTDVTRTLGLHLSGGVAELLASDDTYYILQSGPGFDPSEPHPARADVGFDTGGFAASTLDITLEEKANIGGPTAVVLLRNWNTAQWDELNRFALAPTDQTFELAGIAAGDYINGANRIEVRVRTFAVLILNPTVRGIFSHDFVGVTMRE